MAPDQRLRVGRTYAGKTVTVVVEDTHFRIYDGLTELAVHPRTTMKWVRIYKAGIRQQVKHLATAFGQSCPDIPHHQGSPDGHLSLSGTPQGKDPGHDVKGRNE